MDDRVRVEVTRTDGPTAQDMLDLAALLRDEAWKMTPVPEWDKVPAPEYAEMSPQEWLIAFIRMPVEKRLKYAQHIAKATWDQQKCWLMDHDGAAEQNRHLRRRVYELEQLLDSMSERLGC
jgi:hypothetical protein